MAVEAATMISAIIPITEGADEVAATYREYKRGLEATGRPFEVIYVVDGPHRGLVPTLKGLRDGGEPVKVISFARPFGEAVALTAGFEHARGDVILTLPAFRHFDPRAIPDLIAELAECDMVNGRRWPRSDRRINVLLSGFFHWLLRTLLNSPFHDLGSGVRAFHRRVLEDVRIHGDQHRFLPLLALSQGFAVKEVNIPQPARAAAWTPPPGEYARRLLDVLSIYFLVKFTRKPLRFFGLVGGSILLVGAVIMLALAVQRLFFDVGLADRPILLLGSLLVVLGIQIIAVGLVGEIIIFAFLGEKREYRIERIIGAEEGEDAPPRPAAAPALAPASAPAPRVAAGAEERKRA